MKEPKFIFNVRYVEEADLSGDFESVKYAYVMASDAMEAAIITSTHGTVKSVSFEGKLLEVKQQ